MSPNPLGKQLFSGVVITSATKYLGLIIGLVISAILARLLSPAEFGIVAITTVFISFFNILGDIGIAPSIVQNKSLTNLDIKSIFLLTIIIAISLSIFFFLIAPLVGNFYDSVPLINLCRLLSIAIFFNIIKIVPQAVLIKNLQFKKLGLLSLIAQLIAGVIGIYLAYLGYSFYALVYRSIAMSFLFFLFLFFLNPVTPVAVSKDSINKIKSFSSFQFLFNTINYFSRNLDNILIGKYLGKSSLGYYEKSYYLMTLPLQNLTHVLTPVMHPVLSNFQDDKNRIYSSYKIISRMLSIIGFPLSVFLFFSASDIILIIYGSQWVESIPVFKVLALSVGLQVVLSSSGSIYQAVNRTDLLFFSGALAAIVMLSSISLGVFCFGNLVAIGYCLLGAFTFNFFQCYIILINKALDESIVDYLKIFFIPLLSSICLFAILYFFSSWMGSFKNIYFSLFTKAIITVLTVVPFIFFSKSNKELISKYVLKNKF